MTRFVHHKNAFFRKAGSLLLACFCLLALLVLPVSARTLEMESVSHNLTIHPDASVTVTEYLTVKFNGQWNGFYRDIPEDYGTMLADIAVTENGQAYQFNPGTEYGPPGTFLVKRSNNNATIDWSINAQDETRVFILRYRVLNAVKIHNDTAEFYRKFIGETNGQALKNVVVTAALPTGAEQYAQGKDILIFGHGPLDGEVNFSGSNEIIWQVEKLPAYTFLEGRVLMPTQLFPQAPKEAYTGQDRLSAAIAEEKGWAEKADKERNKARAQMGAGILAVLASLGSVLYMWFKAGRKFATQFTGDYYRELPADYSPAELAVLWHYGDPETKDLTATILDLARRHVLHIQEENFEKKGIFRSKDIITYRIILQRPDLIGRASSGGDDNKLPIQLRTHEKKLLDLLFKTISAGEDHLYMYDIEVWAKENGLLFHDFWSKWKNDLENRGKALAFFDDTAERYKLIGIITGIVMFIIASVMLGKGIAVPFAWGLVIGSVILFVIPLFYKRRSLSGQEDYVKWQAFRRFLLDFSQMERYEIPSLAVWEHYLVYATTLGVAKEVIKQLEVVFPNLQDGDHRFAYGWYAGHALNNTDFLSFNDTFETAIATAEKQYKAATSKSSSSGGGGGFSGGGGGGSGGGGYGGR